MEYWNSGMLAKHVAGYGFEMLERWNVGIVEEWKTGILEEWNDGMMKPMLETIVTGCELP